MSLRKQRLLYLTASRLAAYSLSGGKLAVDGVYERNDQGIAAFTAYLAGSRNLYYLVVDVVEEDYHQDTIPYLGRKDRRQVLARKLAQRYRDTSLALSISLGFDEGERRNERVLYASFSNTQQFQPWLAALEQGEVRLVGAYSTALLAPAVIKGAKLKSPRCLLVSVQPTGLRQSYVEDGQIRFSRIGRLNFEDPEALVATCAAESARLQQYLVTMRLLPTATTPIDVMVLAPGQYHAALTEACRSTEVLKFHVVNAEVQCKATGLSSFPADAPCEALFLHAAASATPKDQFAQDQHRHHYQIWQIGKGLFAGGAAVLAAGLLYAGAQLIDVYNLRQRVQADQTQFDAISAEYARVTKTFPATPTSTENLKTTIKQYHMLQVQTPTPAYLLAEISKTLGAFTQVELERVEWRVGKLPQETGAKTTEPKPATPAPAAEGASATPPAPDLGYQLATVTARIVGARRSDVRAITDMAAQFVTAMRKIPQLEVMNVRMPFDITLDDTLGGIIGSERTIAEDARFSFTVSRKLGG